MSYRLPCRYISSSLVALAKKKATTKTSPARFLGRPSNNLSLGVVGLANIGKSTFFQAITKTKLGNPANYPYATIDAEKSQIVVPSEKLDTLERLYGSKKKIPSVFTVYDIAGLTRNAAKGEGLGNKFLSDIRQVDGLFHIVRGFRDDNIIHTENQVDPVRDLNIVTEELILKDLEFVETGIETLEKTVRKPHANKQVINSELNLLQRVLDLLYQSKKVSVGKWSENDIDMLNRYNFITAKPTLYLLNTSKHDYITGQNEFMPSVQHWISTNCPQDKLVMFSAQVEKELSELASPEEIIQYSQAHSGIATAMPMIVDTIRACLRLISFYTCGPLEARQWSVRQGTSIRDAAGVIHTDFHKTFISATVYKYEDLKDLSPPFDEGKLKSCGKQHKCGKQYTVEDGDVILVKAGNSKPR